MPPAYCDLIIRVSSHDKELSSGPKGDLRIIGAADGTRTRTVSLPGDFKSPVSTDSTTAAWLRVIIAQLLQNVKHHN